MIPILLRVLRAYAPYITLPAAAVIGVIGYNIENFLSDKYTPYSESIQKKRLDRYLEEPDLAVVQPLKETKIFPPTIFDKNVSPSLKD